MNCDEASLYQLAYLPLPVTQKQDRNDIGIWKKRKPRINSSFCVMKLMNATLLR